MNEFAYHMVPKKQQSQVRAEQKVFDRSQEVHGLVSNASIRKKKLKGSSKPIVIAIDEDQLIDKNIEIIDKSYKAEVGNSYEKGQSQER